MSSRESVERIVSIAALSGGALLLSSCAESKLVTEGVDEQAHKALRRFKPLIGDKDFETLDGVEYASKLQYRSNVIGGSSIDFYMEKGYEAPDPSQLDAVAGFVKQKTKDLHHVRWAVPSRDYFITTLDYLPTTHRFSAFANARPYDELSKTVGMDTLYTEFCQGLVSASNDVLGIGVDTQEALCNEVGAAVHSARSGLGYEDYKALHKQWEFPLRGRNVKRVPFSETEYDFFCGVFGDEKLSMTQELKDLSVSVALTTYTGRKDPAFVQSYLSDLGTKGFVPSEFPAALEALAYFTQEASAGNFV